VTVAELLAPLRAGIRLNVKVDWRPGDAVIGLRVSPGSRLAAGMLRVWCVPCVAVRVEWSTG
jgi:hypothetical protein